MTKDDETCLKLGRELVRMIHELQDVSQNDVGYTRRRFTFPGGEVHLCLVKDKSLADLFDAAVASRFNVTDVTPPSQTN
jgi:hypothetical protein